MAERWRLIRSGALPGGLNMALDEALLEAVAAGRSEPILRLYRWDIPTLTLGYAQLLAQVDLEACRDLGVVVVRRPTGGRAVLHDREATYAVIAPDGGAGILRNYRQVAGALRAALEALGLPAVFSAERRGGQGAQGACFTAPSRYELLFRGRKMTGSAQRRVAGVFLQHGSIPLEMDLAQLARILPEGRLSLQERIDALAGQVGWINKFLKPPIDLEALERSLLASFRLCLGVDLVESPLSEGEIDRARELWQKKYLNL